MKTTKYVIYCAMHTVILLIIELMVLVRLVWCFDWTVGQSFFLIALGVVQICMRYFGKSKQFPAKYVTFMRYCTTVIASLIFTLIVVLSWFILESIDEIDLYAVVSSVVIQIVGYISFLL